MKLERIALSGFLSHKATDWSPNGARLVSLVGPNGAGKSTLASDAPRYALFDSARGKTDDVVTLGATDASVLVEFSHNGNRYRVVRTRTTKAGGKTTLDLAIASGEAWTTLTAESIGETQARISELLRLDADTFASAVLLAQGDANRFADAKASERKRILSTVLGLDVYAAAEGRARELARDLDATLAAERAQAERLEDEVAAGREGLDEELDRARAELDVNEARTREAAARRDAWDTRIRELEATLAQAKAIADQVASLEREKTTAAETWRRARARAEAATKAITDLERIVAGGADVAVAIEALPAAQAVVVAFVTEEAEDRRLARDIAEAQATIRDLELPHRQALATWQARSDAAAAKVDELVAHGKVGTSVCVACGQPIVQKVALEQLAAARAALEALGDPPTAPLAIARAQATKIRLEARQRDLGWDPAAMVAARDELTRLERIAARGEAIEAAKVTIARERVAIAEAEAEQAAITTNGAKLAEQLAALQPQLEGRAATEAAWLSARNDSVVAAEQLTRLDGSRRLLERAIAAAETRLEALDRAAAAAAEIRTRLVAGETELGRLRRLVGAFGVTGIPARVIEGVLPELAGYANELLEELRPGMTLELRAQRAKKDGKGVVEALDLVVRDPAGERPLAMYSGGERTSVSLSLAIGLSRLVARRAGARIESLVIDEPDGLDADARRAFGQALRVIAHRGELSRVVLVSHHDDLAEFADEIYQVSKGPTGSMVELVT